MNQPRNESTPAEREQLAQELLELHFGCHEDPEHLEARLAANPALQALQREVLAQARVLEAAVKPASLRDVPPLLLPQLHGSQLHGSQRTTPQRSALRWLRSPIARLLGAAAVAATTVLGFFVAERIARRTHERFQSDHLHLTVSAPQAVPAGAPWSFTVQTRDLRGKPVDAKVTWEAFAENGTLLATAEAPIRGGEATIAMAVDSKLQTPQRVLVIAKTDTDRAQQLFSLSTAAAGPLVHLCTDRPVYRPGEPVFVRAVVLDRLTRMPLQKPPSMVARLLGPNGAAIAQDGDAMAPAGVGSLMLTVPANSAGGPHTVQLESLTGAFAPERAAIVVRSFQAQKLEKQIVLDRSSYAPGARGAATVTVKRLALGGIAASSARAKASLVIDGTEVWTAQKTLGVDGDATFAFVVPGQVDKGVARFVATIDDGGIVETEVKPFVVPTGRVLLAAFPEGGELVAGVDNSVYLECTDVLGRPVDSIGEVVDERGWQVVRFRTAHQGRTKVAFTPRSGMHYRVKLVGHDEPFALPAVQDMGIAMQLRGTDIAANAPLRLAIAGRGDGPWLLGVFCRGALVGQTTLRADDGDLRAEIEVPLPPMASGVLRATVFDRTLQPVAERLIRRIASERLDIAFAPERATPSPGDVQKIGVRTTDENGLPRAAIVGISVSDVAALSLGSEPRVGLVDHAMLFADVEKGEELGDFFLGNSKSAANVDLLLGTRGWRRFVWRNDAAAQAAIAARGPVAEGILAREGFSQTPQVASNLDAAKAPGEELAAAAHRAYRASVDAAGLCLLALLLLLVVEATAWLLRRVANSPPVLQVFVGVAAAGGILLGVTLMVPQYLAAGPDAAAADFLFVARPVPTMLASAATREDPRNVTVTGSDEFFLGGVVRSVRGAKPDVPDSFAVTEMLPATELAIREGLIAVEETKKKNFGSYQQLRRERQYAHRHTATEDRNDFTSTIYWNTLVATDARGEASIEFATSDAVTTWLVHADAHAAAGEGRLGQAEARFATRLPMHIDAKLPDEVAAGDRLLLPIAAECIDPSQPELTLMVDLGKGLQLGGNAPSRIVLQAGRGRALLPITVAEFTGTAHITLEARAGRFADRIHHRLHVAPRGFPHHRSMGGSVAVTMPAAFPIAIPSEFVPGSGRAILKVYPSPISALTEGLEGMLREPSGCFEQASSSNYPNTLVLNLIEANGDNIPAVAARARDLLPRGYKKITGYECKKNGYEWFGADPGHEALTAYGLLQFHDMANVYDVDRAMVQRTQDWLLGRRDGKGNYPHQGLDQHSFGGRATVVTNAYVTYALLQSGTPANELAVELDALVARSTTDDAYELALIACALHLGKRPEAGPARARLAGLQLADGSLRGTTTTITQSGGQDLLVETTGFAILAWLPDATYAGAVRNALEFVQRCRSARGTFGATQATIVALRALCAYATQNRSMRTAGTLQVFADDTLIGSREFSAEETNALQFELWNQLRPGQHTLRIEVDGGGAPLPWAFDVDYHAEQPADDPTGAVAVRATLRSVSAVEGDTIALDIVVQNRTQEALPTPIAIIGIPAGCELPTRVLEDLQQSEAFAFWELRGRELVLYWRSMAAGAEHKLTLDLIARVPGTTTGPASRGYLYYTPAAKRWAAPLEVTVTAR